MTLRTAIASLLGSAPSAESPSVADALATEGHHDLPPELFGAALSSYADLAPVAEADALAPIVTRTGPVPFDDEDLPPIEGDLPADAYALFEAVAPALPTDEGVGDAALDFDLPPAQPGPEAEPGGQPTEEPSGFGDGDQTPLESADDATFDELAELGPDDDLLVDFARGAAVAAESPATAPELDLLDEPAIDLFNSDFTDVGGGEPEADPGDLDAEFE